MLLEGLHIPLTTPFHPDGRLNARKLTANVARYSKTPASGLIVLGPSGEPTLLSDDETREALRVAAEAAAPEKVLIAGISRDSVHATLELANFAAELDCDAILVSVPSFVSPESGSSRLDLDHRPVPLSKRWLVELLTFFQTVADRSPLPVILLNAPGRTIPLSVARKASSHPNIIGLCGTGHSVEVQSAVISSLLQHTANTKREVTVTSTFAAVTSRMKRSASQAVTPLISTAALTGSSTTAIAEPPALRTRMKTVGFQIISAHAPRLLDALNLGAVGIAPAFAACAPQASYEVFAAWKDDDQALVEEKQTRLRDAAQFVETLGPSGLKFACDLSGYFGGPARLPHLPPTGEQRAELQRLMQPLRN